MDDDRVSLIKKLQSGSGSSDLEDLKKFLLSIKDKRENEEVASPTRLKQLFSYLNNVHEFEVGDLVKWKQGLKDRNMPKLGEPAIVLEVLEEHVVDTEEDTGSHYFQQKYDIRLGVLSGGSLVSFLYNSARFEPYEI